MDEEGIGLMRIGIPTAEKSLNAEVAEVFGRALLYLIYDVESEETQFIENEAVHRPGGAGVQAAQLLVDNKVDVVITPQCGGKAQEVLRKAKIRVYRSTDGSLEYNLQAYLDDKLADLDGDKQ